MKTEQNGMETMKTRLDFRWVVAEFCVEVLFAGIGFRTAFISDKAVDWAFFGLFAALALLSIYRLSVCRRQKSSPAA